MHIATLMSAVILIGASSSLAMLPNEQGQSAPPAAPVAPAPPKPSSAATPVPRDEHWQNMHESIITNARTGGFEIAFLGDSITEGWSGAGREVWAKRYAPQHAINLGIGGDRTQQVLWRLDHGLIEALSQKASTENPPKPANAIKAVVLMIGTNNSNGSDNTSEEIAEGIMAITAKLRQGLPQAKVLLLAIFPRGDKPNAQREKNAQASLLASKIADGKTVHYLDISEKFLNKDGTLSPEIMPDYLHLSPKGYEIWAEAIEQKLAELLR